MARRRISTLEVTSAHLKLLDQMYVDWEYMEFGAPSIDPKRPYGNSDVLGDIFELIGPDGWRDVLGLSEYQIQRLQDKGGGEYGRELLDSSEVADNLHNLHYDMQHVLQILIRNRGIEVGKYRLRHDYGIDWEKVND